MSIHFNETKLGVMNDIKQDCLLSLWGVYPQISRTPCRVLQIWTGSPNTPDTAPSPPPLNSKNFSIHLNTAGLANQLIITRNRYLTLLGKICENILEKLEKKTMLMSI